MSDEDIRFVRATTEPIDKRDCLLSEATIDSLVWALMERVDAGLIAVRLRRDDQESTHDHLTWSGGNMDAIFDLSSLAHKEALRRDAEPDPDD